MGRQPPTPPCPICGDSDTTLLAEIDLADLDCLYHRQFGVPVRHLFGERNSLYLWQNRMSDFIWFDPPIPGDEVFYNALQNKPWYYADHKHEFDIAARFISSTDKILEVGSGKGNFGKYIGSPNYVGLDFSENARQLAAANGVEVRTERLHDHVAAHPASYDIVCAFQVLEHVPDVKGFLEAMLAGLRPGGRMIIAVPSQDSYMARAHNLALNMPPHHLSRYTDTFIHRLPDYFPVSLEHAEPDPLQPVHYVDYLTQVCLEAFRKRRGRPYKYIDHSLTERLFKIPAILLGRLLAPGLFAKNIPRGHTITAIYRKK